MRARVGYLVGLAAIASVSWAAAQSEQSPVYLRGYYKLYDQYSVWQYSDHSPWYMLKSAPWADQRLVKWGFVPVTHDSQNYYCLIDHSPPTGSHIAEWTFSCGDPATAELLYNMNWRPIGLLYGAP
jgi:hypothetical protein